MKSGSMGGATVPAPRGPGSDVRRLGVFAVIAVLMMLSVAVVPLVTSGPASSQTAAPSDDYAGQDITYHYGSEDPRQVTVHYDGIAATEYNPEYWEGTFAPTSGSSENWIGPEVTYENLTFQRTVSWSIATEWWGGGLEGGSLTLSTSSDVIRVDYSSGSSGSSYADKKLTVEGSGDFDRNTGSGTFTFTIRAIVSKVFAGWSTSDDGTLDYYPGDVVPSTVTDLYAVWVDPNIYVAGVGDIPQINSGDYIQFTVNPTFTTYKSVSSIRQIDSDSLSTDRIHKSDHSESSESSEMFVNIFSVTSSSGSTTGRYSIDIPCTIRSHDQANLSFGTISLGGDTVIDNVNLTSSAPNNNHGDGSDRGIFANGHRLILGTGIGTGASTFNSAPQVFGGDTSPVTEAVHTGKSIVSADAELSRTVDLGTFVIVHSGTYYNIVGGGADSDIGSKSKPLSTYVVLKGGMSLDTVVGGSGAGGSVYGSAVATWENGPDQGGTYIYSTGFRMPGDSYHESKVGTDYIPDGIWLEESTIMEGGVSGRDSNNYSDLTYVYGSTHIFLSGDTDIWDVQAGSRRAFSHVEFAYLEISGNAVVRHVACGTITDGNRQSSSQSSPMPVTSVDATKIVVSGNAWVASVFGAGYDTWYLPEATTMADGERIDVQIKGGTVGSVYGGGYRGTITVGDPDDTRVDDGVFVEISGGTVLGDVYGGGRGGLDKVTHSSGGGINSEGYMDSTGHSVVIGDVFVIVSGGTVKGNVYGGGESVPKLSSYSGVNATFSASDPDVAAVDGDTYVMVSGGIVEGSVYGGGKGVLMLNDQPYDAPMEVPAIVGMAGSYSYQDILWKSGGGAVYDSSPDYTGYARVTGSTMAMVMGGTVNGNIYGGAEIGRVNATANVWVLGTDSMSIHGSVYGGGEGHEQHSDLGAVSNTSVRVADADVEGNVYGGGAYGMVVSVDGTMGTADVSVESSTVRGDVYGGGQGLENRGRFGGVGVTILDISDSTVNGSVYGGGQYGAVDTTGVTVTGSIVNGSIYGGGLGTADRVSVYRNITLTVNSTTVEGNIYGGSAYGLVEGNIVTELRGGTVASTVYGGGLGTSNRTSTSGSRTVRLEDVRITGSLYGGSQNGDDGAASLDGYTFVYILSAEIGGSVFGGGYRGTTWGNTYVYIGCTDSETPHEGTVTIGQSVYGGGDVGDVSAGDALFDTTLVYGNSELIVDGSSCTINFNGSLFGEGNSCLTEGDTSIHITDASLRMMSVQRADTVRITSSEIHLEGRNSGASSSASEKFSFYSVGRLDLVGGSQIYLSSPLGETGDFYSLATPSVLTTQTAPLNTIYVEEGTIFSLQNSEGFGSVYGYTILSLLASETYYGAFAYGSVDSVGGFVTEDEGLYRTLQYSDLSSPECRYWYIPGVVSQTGSAVLKYDPSLGEDAVVSVDLALNIPMTSSSTSLLYGGGYFTSATADSYKLVSGDPTEYSTLSVLMGYGGEGLTTFNGGSGLYVPDRSSETTSAVLEDAGGPDSPKMGIRVSGINPMLSGYAGTVTIQFQEVVVADSPAGESNYVYFNTIDVSIAIYIEGHDHPHEGTSTIDIIAGSGQSSIVIPALGYEGDLYVTDARFNGGSLEGAPALTISGVNNHEGSMGWTGGGFEHVLATGSESAYLGRFTGMFPSTIQFSIEGFEGTDCSFAVDFEVRDGSGTMYRFTITVKVVTHGPVTVTFVDSRQNVSIPMQFDYGTTITASDGPQVMGNFIGWYNDETFTSQFNFNSPLIRDITLYARYMYTVTFDEMYDGRTSTYYVPMGEPFTIDNYGDKDPVRPGYSFTGWYKDRDCLVLWDFQNDKVEGDITLYAGWQPRGVILDFYNEDGDVILTLGAGEGERIRLDDLFGPYLEQASDAFGTVPEGGTLVWHVSVSGSSIPVYADNIIEQRMVTVENGGWHVKVHADVLYNSITVVQDAQDYGSSVVPPKEFSVGPEGGYYTFTPTGANRVGYELSGWIIEETGQEYAPGVTIKIPASEVSKYLSEDGKLHLVAQWRVLTYEVVVMKPAGGSVTATLISSDGSTSSGREYTSYISFSAHYGDRLSLSYVSEGGYTFEGWVVSKAGAIDDASKQSTYMTVRGDSRVEVRVGGLESAVIRLSVDGEAPGGSITLTGDGRTYTVRQSSVDGEYGVFSVSALLGEYALSYGGSGFGTITVVSGGVSGSYRLVSLALEVTPDADVGTLPSYAVPGTQLALDIPHGYSVSKLTLGYDGADHDMGAVSGFTVPSAQSTGVTVKVELETSNYTIEFVVDFTGSDGAKVVFDTVESITVEYSPDGTVYPELPWVQLNGLDLNALDRETTSPYSFLGWYLDEGFMQRVQAGDAFPEEDVVLHASIADRKEIIYVVNVYMMGIGGDYPPTPTYEIQTIELENQYVGWRPDYPGFTVDAEKSSDYETTVVEAGMDNLNIYMVRASGTAVLDPAGGTVSESGGWTLNGEGKLIREIWYGETVTLPVPVKMENVFGGWSVDGSTVTQVTVGDDMWDQADNTVSFEGTAQWTVNEYRLVLSTLYGTFSNGQTTMTVSVPYGTPLSDVLDEYRAELEEEAGMYAVFGGWIPAPPETMPADKLTLTAQWTPKKVSITVTGDEHVTISVTGSSLIGSDGSYESVFNGSIDLMLSFDSGYSLYEATGAKEQPVRKSAVQFEWTVPLNSGNVTVGEDGTLSLVLEVTSVESAVTVTYVINGTPAASLFQNVPSGENVVLHDLSELKGLTFDGWYSDPEMNNKIEDNTISFVDADDREVVYGSLTADKPTGHITASGLVLDNGVYVGTYNGGRHTLTAVPDTYAEGSTPLDYDLTYRIIWGDTENKTVSFTNAGDYSVTLTVTATLAIGGTVSDVSEPYTKDFTIRIDKADAEVVWVHADSYIYNGTDRSGTVYAYYVGMDGRNHQLTVSFPDSFMDVGDYIFTVPGEDSNHTFSNTELQLSIEKKVLTIAQSGSLSYSGQAQSPAFTDDRVTGDDISYDITDSKTDAGTYTISLAGVQLTGDDAGNYELPASVTWTIDRVAAEDLIWKVVDTYTYTGSEVIPKVQAYIGDSPIDMVLGEDYSVAGMQGRNNTDAGTAYVMVECTGNYSGRAIVEFEIGQLDLSTVVIKITGDTTYTGKQIIPGYTVTAADTPLRLTAEDVRITFGDNINVADGGSITISDFEGSSGNCVNSVTKEFTIRKAELSVDITGDLSVVFGEIGSLGIYGYSSEYGGTVSWTSSATDVAEVNGGGSGATVTPVSVGQTSITLRIEGMPNYLDVERTVILYVTNATIPEPDVSGYSGVYDAQQHGAIVLGAGTEGYTVTYSVYGDEYSSKMPQVRDVADSGVYYVKFEMPNYAPLVVDVEVAIIPAEAGAHLKEDIIYNGEAQTAEFVLDGIISGDDVDFTVVEGDSATDAHISNTAVLELTGEDAKNYAPSIINVQWGISPAALEIVWGQLKFVYSGEDQAPVPVFTDVSNNVPVFFDTEVHLHDSIVPVHADAGTYTIAVNDPRLINYELSEGHTYEVEFTIAPQEVSLDSVELVYNSRPQTPTFVLPVLIDAEVSVGAEPKTDVGGYTATFTITGNGAGNYVPASAVGGAGTASWSITPLDITGADVIVNGDYTYAGGQIVPAESEVTVKVTVNGVEITLPSGDYTFSATDNVNAGEATLTVSGTGSCTGTATGAFTIDPAQLPTEGWTVTNEHTYTGASHGDDILVSNGALVQGKDFTVSSDSIDAGDAIARIAGIGNYTGEAEVGFTIEKYVIQVSLDRTQFTYNGQVRTVELDTSAVFNRDEGYVSFSITGNVSAAAVGDYIASVVMSAGESGDRTGNYVLSSDTLGWSIVKGSLTFEQNELNYNGEEQSPSFVMSGFVDGEDVKFSVTAVEQTDAGSYMAGIDVTGTHADNYTWPDQVEWSISPMDITAVRQDGTLTYNGSIQSPEFTMPGSFQRDEVLVQITGGVDQATDAGSYAAVVMLTGNGAKNYNLISTGAEWTIGKLTLQVSLDEKEFVYDRMEHKVTPSYAGVLDADAGDVTVTFAGDTSAVDAGDYAVTVSLAGDRSHNYALPSESLDWKISKRTIQVSLVQDEFTYNGRQHDVQLSDWSSYVIDGDAVDVEMTAGGYATAAGDYKASLKLTDASGNYQLSATILEWSISKLDLSDVGIVISPDADLTYNGTAIEPGFTVRYNGVVIPSADYTSAYGDNINAGTGAGSITVTAKQNGNLTGEETFRFDIGKAAATVEWILKDSYKYDGTNQIGSVDAVLKGVGDEASVTLDVSTQSGYAFMNAGEYVLVADVSGYEGNYDITGAEQTVTMQKRSVTLTSESDSKVYDGTALSNVTVIVGGDGFVGGEGATYTVTGSQTDVGHSSNVFTYNLSSGTLADNYYIAEVEGTLTVTVLNLSDVQIEVSDDGLVYDGSIKTPGVTVTYNGVTVPSSNYELEYSDNTDAGEATVTITAVGSNCTGTAIGKFNIAKAQIPEGGWSITSSHEYTGAAQAGIVAENGTYPGLVQNTDFTVSSDDVNAGPATATVTGTGNYVGEVTVQFQIGKKEVTVHWNSDSIFTYNGHNQAPTFTVVSGIDGIAVTAESEIRQNGTAVGSHSDAGDYVIAIIGLDNSNFALPSDGLTKEFTISKATLTIGISGFHSTDTQNNEPLGLTGYDSAYGGTIAWTSSDTGVATISGDGTAIEVVPASAGTTTITVSVTGMRNHQDASAEIEFTVNDAVITGIKITGYSGTYDGQAHDVIVSITGTQSGDVISYLVNDVYTQTMPQVTDVADSGTYRVMIEREGHKPLYVNVSVTVSPLSIDDAEVTINGTYTYTSSQIRPTDVSVTVGGLTVPADAYELGYGDNMLVSTGGTVRVTAVTGSNFTGTASGIFAIGKAEARIVWTGAGAEYTYDGTDQKGKITAVFEGVGGELSVPLAVIIGSRSEFMNAGEYTFSVDVSRYGDNYSISGDESVNVTMGKRPVTLTSASGEKTYDGTPLTNGAVTVSGDGFVTGEGATYNVTGSQTAAGSSENTFTYSLKEGTLEDNYHITQIDGTLEVTERTLNLAWSGHGDLVYNGSDQTPTYTDDRVGGDELEFNVTIEKDGSAVSGCVGAGSYTITVSVSGGEDAANYALVNGTLAFTIGKADATIVWTGTDADYTYNGKDQSSGITAVFKGVGTEASVDLGITISLNGSAVQGFTDAGTYTFSVDVSQYGANYEIAGSESVSVDMSKKTLSIIWGDADFTYNGQQQRPTVEFGGFAEGDSAEPVWSVSGDDATYTDAGAYTITVTGIDGTCASNYALPSEASLEFEIERMQISASQAAEFTYDGTDKTVSFVLSGHIEADKGRLDYSIISGGTQKNAGTHIAVVGLTGEAAGNYRLPSVESASRILLLSANEDQYNVQWTIGQLSIEGAAVTIGGYDSVYDGNAKKPGVTGVTLGELVLTDEDYSVSYRDNTDAGTAHVVITAKEGGNYTGEVTVGFQISKKKIEVSIDTTVQHKYDGTEKAAVLDGNWNSYVEERDSGKVTVSLGGGRTATNAGTYTVTVVLTDGSGNYELSVTELEWSIAKRMVTLTSTDESKVYDGTALEGGQVNVGGDGFADGEGATYTFTGSQTVEGSSNNEFTYVLNGDTLANNYEIIPSYGNLTVSPRPITDTGVTIEGIGSCVYTGSENKPDIEASFNGASLVQGKDYTLSYSGDLVNVTADGVTVKITGRGNYSGEKELTFRIVPASIGNAVIGGIADQTYDGSEIEPTVTVAWNGNALVEGSDYDVSYSNNVNAGTAVVTISGKGNFTGDITATFTIAKATLEVVITGDQTTDIETSKELAVSGYDAAYGGTIGWTASPGGIVTIGDGTTAVNVIPVSVGTVTITVAITGMDNYEDATASVTFTVSKGSFTVDVEGYTGTYDGAEHDAFTATSEDRDSVSYSTDGEHYTDGIPKVVDVVDSGTFYVKVEREGYHDFETTVQVSISPADINDADISPIGDRTYTGSEICPGISVGFKGVSLIQGQDYTLSYSGELVNVTEAGVAVKATGIGNFSGVKELTFSIVPKEVEIEWGSDLSFTYNGGNQAPTCTISSGIDGVEAGTVGFTVTKDGSETESYADVGSYVLTITSVSNANLTVPEDSSIEFRIGQKTVDVSLSEGSFTYNGQAHKVNIVDEGIIGTDVEVSAAGTTSATNAGTYTVTLSLTGDGKGNYKLSATELEWTIDPLSLDGAEIAIEGGDFVYTGGAITPDVTVKVDGTPLMEGTDYTLSYGNNTNAGEGHVIITAKDNYEGSITVPFDIAPKALAVKPVYDSFIYDGVKHTVVLGDILGVVAGDDVVVSLKGETNATHAGEYHVDVVMTGADAGNYYLQTTGFTWIIKQRGLHDAVVTLVDGSTYTYTGSQIMPKVTITVGGMTPEKGTDYSVSYSNNIDAGTAKVIITAEEDGDYTGFISVNFEIAKKVLEPVLSEDRFVYDRLEHTVELGDLSASIAQGDDLKVHLKGTISATDAGTYHVEAVMEGSDARNYSLKVTEFTWSIEKADLGSAHVTVPGGLIHTGSSVEPDASVELGRMTLVVGRDYTLSYENNVDAGRASVTVTAVEDGNFHGSVTVGFDIGRAHLDLVDVAEPEDAVYHGSAHTPEISAEYNELKLTEGTHYTVEYHDNIEAGTATVVLMAVDGSNFTGYRHLTFNISPASVDGFGIDDIDDRVYTGSPIEPGISAVFNGVPLTEWEDYVLRYVDNTDAGTAIVIIEGRGNFSGVREICFMIVPASMEDVSIAPVPDQMYTGAEVRPGITATLNGVPLVEGEDYILSYVGDTVNVTGDCVYVVAEGIGNLTGTVSIPYRIVYDGLQDITGITVNGYTGVYDGSEHIAVTVIGTMQGDKVSYSTDGTTFVSEVPTVTHVSDSGVVWVKVERPGCVPTMFGVSVTVAPAGLTVESSSVQGMYDGEPLTGHEVTVVNGQLFGDDGFIWVFTGQQIAPGSSANTFVPAALPGTEAGDYIITLVYGTLTVDQSAISESSSWVLAFILAIGIAAASYHGIMWVSGGRPLEALSALASRLASAIRRE